MCGYKQSPGKVGQRLNYALNETVVTMQMSGKVQQARKEVWQQYKDHFPDTGWDKSVTVNKSHRHGHKFTDNYMTNYLLPENLESKDSRKLKQSTYYPPQQNYDAFDRGEVTTGWNNSTLLLQQDLQKGLESLTLKANENKQRNKADYVKRPTLIERYKKQIFEDRVNKATQGEVEANLISVYGEEGFEHLKYIMQQLQERNYKPSIYPKTKKQDVEVVLQLPPIEDEQVEQKQPQKQSTSQDRSSVDSDN